MDRERLPQWGWLLVGLVAVTVGGAVLNAVVLEPIVPEEYVVVTLIAGMSLVFIYVSIWHDEERAEYRDRSRAGIAGDVVFILLGAITMSAMAVALTLEWGLPGIVRELVAMVAGFLAAWALFYWRNTGLYRA